MISHIDEPIVTRRARHLKWRALDPFEYGLMVVCGLLLLGFTLSELGDVVFRLMNRPWLSAQEFSIAFFVWGVFMGGAVAVRREQHFKLTAITESLHGVRRTALETFNRLVVFLVGIGLLYFGYLNFLTGFGSFLQPSRTPIAVLYAAIPVSGALIALFSLEHLINGWRHGFEGDEPESVLERVDWAD
jgi:TRAP-type C4-dicarboxylate transport system permease small subunit